MFGGEPEVSIIDMQNNNVSYLESETDQIKKQLDRNGRTFQIKKNMNFGD